MKLCPVPGIDKSLRKVFKKVGSKLAFKAPRNLASVLTSRNKPQLPPNKKVGVYFTPTDCDMGYTGETGKMITTRTKQHEKAIFDVNRKDAIAAHVCDCHACDCDNKLDRTQVVAVEPNYYRRKVRESLEIRRLKTGPADDRGLNKDLGDYVTTSTWNPLFEQINSDPRAKIKTFESMTN